MKNVSEYLGNLGFTPSEAVIYLTLLKTGPLSVKELAEKIKMNRTALYAHIAPLQENGIVLSISVDSRKQFAASEPERLQYIIDKKREAINSLQLKFPSVLELLDTSSNKSSRVFKIDVKYYKGKNGMKKIWMEMFQAETVRVYAKLSEITTLFPDETDLFEQALKKHPRLHIYEIYGDKLEDIKKLSYRTNVSRYHYRFMPASVGLTSPGIIMYDNKVAIINADEKISATVLYNKDYYTNSIKLFDFIWNALPTPQI